MPSGGKPRVSPGSQGPPPLQHLAGWSRAPELPGTPTAVSAVAPPVPSCEPRRRPHGESCPGGVTPCDREGGGPATCLQGPGAAQGPGSTGPAAPTAALKPKSSCWPDPGRPPRLPGQPLVPSLDWATQLLCPPGSLALLSHFAGTRVPAASRKGGHGRPACVEAREFLLRVLSLGCTQGPALPA